ncbi:LuxR family transcriptional regulator [Deinococcus sp. QL22]|uniref:LuxR family transcriptional regulator n=1 Tax=Deinococcus sp. QL22 TaxID=2939437 RepID=UPI002017818C|nr:LuxR family transcriptional regulator [Deinococcus sp. QL22]UQN09438.1 LuxR family transcriptional regulator [Deinococcus sp. QL22]
MGFPEASVHPQALVPRALQVEVVRSELLEQLAGADRPCVAVVAPSGYGKTTLLAQYARSTARSVAWLTLAESDVETGQLFLALQRALHAYPGLQIPLDNLPTPDRFLSDLVRRLSEMDGCLDLILDRAERVTRLQGSWLGQLVDALPEGHRLILAGYDLNGFPLARLVASGHVQLVTHTQLRFTLQDTETFLQLREASQDAAALQDALEGWPVGVALACVEDASPVELDDLLHDVLDRLPGDVRQALPELALMEEWSENMGLTLGLTLPANWLRTTRQAGLPLTPLGRGLYRPHTLLLDTLRTELERDPARALPLHLRLAEQAVQQGDLTRAVQHAAWAGDVALLEQSAQTLFPRLRGRHEFALLADLTALHPAPLPAWWQEYSAVAQIETGQVAAGLRLLEQLEQAGALGTLGYAALALQAARRGDFEQQLQQAERGLALPDSPVHQVLNMQRASALISLQRPEEGLEVSQQMVEEARRRGLPLDEANGLNTQQYALMMLRRWDEQEDALTRARALFAANGRASSVLQIDQQLLDIHLLHGRTAEAETLLRDALPAAERNQPVLMPTLLLAKARLLLARSDWSAAAEALDQAEARLQSLGLTVLLPFVHFTRFDLCTAQGDAPAASRAFDVGVTTSVTPLLRDLYLPFYEGARAFDTGDWPRARKALGRAAHESAERGHQLRATVLLAALEEATGQSGSRHLQAVAEQFGALDAALVCAADQPRLTALVTALQERQPDHPLARLGPLRVAHPPASFLVHAESQVRVTFEGQPVRLPLSKAGELLLWLLWYGSGTLPEILNALWDGSRDPRHHEYYRVVVRRLRATLRGLIGQDLDPVPHIQGRYSLHPNLVITSTLHQALQQARQGNPVAILQLRADELLADVESEWVEALREAVRREQHLVLGDLEGQLASRDPDRAVQILKDSLRHQTDQEAFHLSLIRTLLLHRPVEAPAAYQGYVHMLETAHGQTPDPAVRRALTALGLNA